LISKVSCDIFRLHHRFVVVAGSPRVSFESFYRNNVNGAEWR